jgi:NAD-dependent SIR2 family protein deacetylase
MSNYCQFCTNAFNSIQQCYQHTRLAHEVDVHQYWFPCPDCQKYFPNNGSLISHKKRYCLVCDHCNKLLPNRSQLRYHVEQIHSEVLMSKSWKKCSALKKSFKSDEVLIYIGTSVKKKRKTRLKYVLVVVLSRHAKSSSTF